MYVYCIYNTYIFPHPIFEQCGPTSDQKSIKNQLKGRY